MSTSEEQQFATRAKAFFTEAAKICMEGTVENLQTLVNQFLGNNPKASINEIFNDFNTEGRKLIHLASRGKQDIFEYILENCGDKVTHANAKDDFGFTPLINATISEADSIIEKLLELGVNVNDRNEDGASAAHFAAGDGVTSRLQRLRSAGASLTFMSASGTPLHWAAGKGRSAAIQYLITQEVDINVLSKEGSPAVLMAACSSCDMGVKYLVEAGADIGHIVSGNLTTLAICAENGLTNAVASIIKTDTGLRCCDIETSDGNKPIHLAAMVKNIEVVKILLPIYMAGTSVSDEEQLLKEILTDGARRMKIWENANVIKQDAEKKKDLQESLGNDGGVIEIDWKKQPTAAEVMEADGFKESGNLLYKEKQFEDAVQAYTKGVIANPRNEVLWSNRSACYLALKLPQKALRDAEVCRRLKPDWTRGCYRLASARLALGQYEDAAVAAFEGVKIDEHNKELKTLMKLAVKRGQDEHKAKMEQKNQK